LSIRKIDDTHFECKAWFVVTNEHRNTARRVRVEIRTTSKSETLSQDDEPRFPTFQRVLWELPDQSTAYETDIRYKDERKLNWFTIVLEIRHSGDKFSYYVGGHEVAFFLTGMSEETLPIVGIWLSMIGEGGFEKEFAAILWATANTQQPLRVALQEWPLAS